MIDTSTIEGKIAVMQAYKDGKKIEFKTRSGGDTWGNVCIPRWDWQRFDYRVKPEPKYVPYDSVIEVDRDKWVMHKISKTVYRIDVINKASNEAHTFIGWLTLFNLFDRYTYEDGTPCGKLADE